MRLLSILLAAAALHPEIPRTWTDAAVADLEVPLARPLSLLSTSARRITTRYRPEPSTAPTLCITHRGSRRVTWSG